MTFTKEFTIMAEYKNRQVDIVREIDNVNTLIAHREPGLPGTEIVPSAQVTVTEEEMKKIEEARKSNQHYANFRVKGKNDQEPVMAPSATEVQIQRMAEDNLARVEKQREEQAEWEKKHPNLPSSTKQQLDAIKVVPYRDEKPAKVEVKK